MTSIFNSWKQLVELTTNGLRQIRVISSYLTGTARDHNYTDYRNDIIKLTSTRNALIFGDFNSKHPYWGCIRENRAGKVLFNTMMTHDFEIFAPPNPTYFPGDPRLPSTLDFMISTSSLQPESVNTTDDLGSDHLPVLSVFDIEINPRMDYNVVPSFKHADWPLFRRTLDDMIDLNYFQPASQDTTDDIDQRVAALTRIIRSATDTAVPKIRIRSKGVTPSPHTLRLIRLRRAAKRRFIRSGRDEDKQQLQVLKSQVEYWSRIDYNNHFQNWVHSLEPGENHNKKIFRLTKTLKNCNRTIPVLIHNGLTYVSDVEKANLLADAFSGNINTTVNDPVPTSVAHAVSRSIETLESFVPINNDPSLLTTPKEVMSLVRALKNSKAPGIDMINNRTLKQVSRKTIVALVYIFNSCLQHCYFPSAWKEAVVVPILKPNKPANNPTSFRFVHLLPSPGKLFERLILSRINVHLDNNEIVPPFQFGFKSGHSTVHQVVRVTKLISQARSQGASTGLLLMDNQAAFDCVWHDALLHKMMINNFSTHIVKLIQSYLSGRKFRVKVNHRTSSPRDIPAGVPQGGVLSPTLFNVFMFDTPTQEGCDIAQFADDVMYMCSNKRAASVTVNLERAGKQYSKYCKTWRLKLNPSKTEALFCTRRTSARGRPRRPIKIQNHNILWSDSVKYLGVTIDKRLTFKDHVSASITKVGRCIRSLYSILNRNSKLHTRNKLLLFKTILRPTMLYGSPVWRNCAMTHRKKLQVMQNKCLKMCLNRPFRYPTLDLHVDANIEMIDQYTERIQSNFRQRCRYSEHTLINSL